MDRWTDGRMDRPTDKCKYGHREFLLIIPDFVLYLCRYPASKRRKIRESLTVFCLWATGSSLSNKQFYSIIIFALQLLRPHSLHMSLDPYPVGPSVFESVAPFSNRGIQAKKWSYLHQCPCPAYVTDPVEFINLFFTFSSGLSIKLSSLRLSDGFVLTQHCWEHPHFTVFEWKSSMSEVRATVAVPYHNAQTLKA